MPALPPGACVGSMRMPPSKLAVAHDNESPGGERGCPTETEELSRTICEATWPIKPKTNFQPVFFVRKDIHP